MAKITLGLDVDGVLLDYMSGLFRYLREIGVSPICEANEVDSFSLSTALPYHTQEDVRNFVTDFSLTPEFGQLAPFPYAIESINRLKNHFDEKIRIVAVTSAGTSAMTKELRIQNLRPFPFDEIHVLPLGSSKADDIAKFEANSIFVDDLIPHVHTAEKLDVKGILFRQSYNVNDLHDLTMACWKNDFDLIFRAIEDRVELSRIPALSA